MSIISHAIKSAKINVFIMEDPRYPVCIILKYEEPAGMRGAQTAQPFDIYYAVLLRAQFRPAHSTEDGPLKELYFKVLPTGSSSLTAAVLGFPVLDV